MRKVHEEFKIGSKLAILLRIKYR